MAPGGAFHGGPSVVNQRCSQGGAGYGPAGSGQCIGEHRVKESGVVLTPWDRVRDPRGAPGPHPRPGVAGQPVPEQSACLGAGIRKQFVLSGAGQHTVFGCARDRIGYVRVHLRDPLRGDGLHRLPPLSRKAGPVERYGLAAPGVNL